MQFIDLKAQYGRIGGQIDAAVQKVLEHGAYIQGPEVKALEKELAGFVGRKHAINCANGTDALLIPLLARQVGPGDAVFTSSFTFFATAEVIAGCGATPVFVDIDEKSYNLAPVLLEEAIRKVESEGKLTPRCIIPVNIFGQCADYQAILPIAERHGLWVLEDAAQSFGAEYRGRKSCSFGTVSATSFFPAKPLGCYGDGGMLFTDDDELAALCRSIAIHGKGTDKYDNVRIGMNSRLDTIQAAILLEKFRILPDEIAKRQTAAACYDAVLEGSVTVPYIAPENLSAWAQYCVRSPRRAELLDALKSAGIPTAIYYPTPLHRSTAFAYLGYGEGSLPVTEWVSREVFALPMHPYLEKTQIEHIAEVIRKAGV